MNAAADTRHEAALAGLRALRRTEATVLVAALIAFAVGLGLLAVFWLIVVGYQRRAVENEYQALHATPWAERLFVSRHTVSYHLHKVYTKLGITSRGALAQLDLHNGRSARCPGAAPPCFQLGPSGGLLRPADTGGRDLGPPSPAGWYQPAERG